MKIRIVILMLGLAYSALTLAEVTVKDLVDVQLSVKSMEIGIKAGIINNCEKAGTPQAECVNSAKIVDRLDLQSIMEQIYGEVYTQQQVEELYEFYSSPVGKKYSEGMLAVMTEQINYFDPVSMPDMSEAENNEITEFQASPLSKMEADARPRIQAAINQYLVPALQDLMSGNN